MSKYRVPPDSKIRLEDFDPADHGEFSAGTEGHAEMEAQSQILLKKLENLQTRLYAESKQALLIVLQAMDAGGKDGSIKHVMSGVNPQGCRVTSFKVPTSEERAHDFLWRVHRQVPPHGAIGIFNRSHYEDVLVPRAHGTFSDKEVRRRMKQIVRFEELLTDSGTAVVKFFLHISYEEQRRRFEERLHDPQKYWKFNAADLHERTMWADYMKAYEEILPATSTDEAPWYVIPANHKRYRDVTVARLVVKTLERMNPQYPITAPTVDPAAMSAL